MIYTTTHKKFDKSFKKAHTQLQIVTKERLKDFVLEQNKKSLNDHKLEGKWSGHRSINITGDYRAIYRVVVDKPKTVQFVAIGTHSELYQ